MNCNSGLSTINFTLSNLDYRTTPEINTNINFNDKILKINILSIDEEPLDYGLSITITDEDGNIYNKIVNIDDGRVTHKIKRSILYLSPFGNDIYLFFHLLNACFYNVEYKFKIAFIGDSYIIEFILKHYHYIFKCDNEISNNNIIYFL